MACLAIPLLALPLNAYAQDDITSRLNRLENDISTLNRAVYRGQVGTSGAPASGGLSPADLQANAEAQIQIQQLESQIRDLTGKLEEQAHELRMLRRAFDKAQSDTTLRLDDLEKNKPAIAGNTQPAQTQSAASPAKTQPKAKPAAKPQTLGTITAPDTAVTPRDEAASTTSPPSPASPTIGTVAASGDPAADYDAAFGLLKQGQYKSAQLAFENFLTAYPDNSLISNAQYWLGETFYVRGDYTQAARVFAEGFQTDPKGSKAADNLLKLGISLASLGKTDDACLALNQVGKEFPTGAASATRRAKQELTRLNCQ